jgi:hypothetical protein
MPSPGLPLINSFITPDSAIGGDTVRQTTTKTGLSPRNNNILFALFIVLALSVTAFQKIGYGTSSQNVVALAIPVFVFGIALACVFVKPVIDPVRVAGYFLFVTASAASTALLAPRYSPSSLFLFAILYLPMIVSFEIPDALYRRCMNAFITIMLFFCAVTIAQHVIQIVSSARFWPDPTDFFPDNMLIPEFNYTQSIVWGSKYMKPNGVSFLEVSMLSQYIALALALELVLFQRTSRMVIFGVTIMLTFAGTGVLLLLITLPVLLGRLPARRMAIIVGVLMLVSYIAFKVGWFDIISNRMNEYKHNGSSANMRFIEPLDRLIAFLGNPDALFGGIGAGQIEKGRNFQWWPFTKASIEYGLIPGVLFYGYFLYSLFRNTAHKSLAFTLAVWFTFEGALLTAINPLTCVLLGTLFVLPRKAQNQPDEKAPLPPPARTPVREKRVAPEPRPARNAEAVPEPAMAAKVETNSGNDLSYLGTPDTGGRQIYAIGDVHGRADLLEQLMAKIQSDIAASGNGMKPLIVFLGDYVDRGMRSRQVIDQIIALEKESSIEVRSLLGNHEEAMLSFLDKTNTGMSWGRHGGLSTLGSYGVTLPRGAGNADDWKRMREELTAHLPEEHLAFLRDLEKYVVVGDIVFVHAGLRAGVPLAEQELRDLLYIRKDFMNTPVDAGILIVHGHTPGDTVYGAQGRVCLDTGAYATGILTAVRFDGTAPVIIDVGRKA